MINTQQMRLPDRPLAILLRAQRLIAEIDTQLALIESAVYLGREENLILTLPASLRSIAQRRRKIQFELSQLVQPEDYERPTRLPPALTLPS